MGRVDTEGVSHIEEYDHIEPPFPALELSRTTAAVPAS
jgi:hypothetical protein